ncbi:MAG: heme NO-binding domain-containing protein [Gemmobacter sp.]|jgi:hypothetical protein|nr:heme NO-binding domain-containing protein [Gemmobacter sp.]
MHGLINRSLQCFLRDTYGPSVWAAVAREAGLGFDGFEPMLTYDPKLTEAVVEAASHLLHRPRDTVLEDLGTYLVSHPNMGAPRRLLRFGGVGYADFLHSLEELPGRARLALPELDLPALELTDHSAADFTLICRSPLAGAAHVVVGLLRAMADDYGVLCLVEHRGHDQRGEVIGITLAETAFSPGRRFDLAAGGQG